MPKTHPSYAPEYRRQIVELVRAGRTPTARVRKCMPCSRHARRRCDLFPLAFRTVKRLARL